MLPATHSRTDRSKWMRHARELAKSGKYATFSDLEEELRSGQDYAIAIAVLSDIANRYQLRILFEKARSRAQLSRQPTSGG